MTYRALVRLHLGGDTFAEPGDTFDVELANLDQLFAIGALELAGPNPDPEGE